METQVEVNHWQLLSVIARSLDSVGVNDALHARRVAHMVHQIAGTMKLSDDRRELLTGAALLHDCGVSSRAEQRILIDTFISVGSDSHCLRGYEFLNGCLPLRQYATLIRYHNRPWRHLQDLAVPDADKQANALIFLCDYVDHIYMRHVAECGLDGMILRKDAIVDTILSKESGFFSDALIGIFAQTASREGFWYSLRPEYVQGYLSPIERRTHHVETMSLQKILSLSTFLSRIIDAKSTFTQVHSERVAVIARLLAEAMGLSDLDQTKIQIAGLLHDIGKLQLPDHILHKPGALTGLEFASVKRHTLDTRLVLDALFPGSPICTWAAQHHEKLNGSGYPFGLKADAIDLPTRILTISDIFQALTQERPYRGRFSPDQVLKTMGKMVEDNEIDGEVFSILKNDVEEYYAISAY